MLLEDCIQEKISQQIPLSGGCIHRAQKITTESGNNYFVKTSDAVPADMFEQEALALEELTKAEAFRIPKVIFYNSNFLVLEWIEAGRKGRDFYRICGELLAKQHRVSTLAAYGWPKSNYIGTLVQKNDWQNNWADFWLSMRLQPQIDLAQKYFSSTDLNNLEMLFKKVAEIIGNTATEAPALLHGDLWGGNHMADEKGQPCLYDPAAYFGNREADLAMTAMFQGYPPEFLDAYNKSYPLQSGYSERRIHLYLLYHHLSHLNHFGTSYLDGVRQQIELAIR